MSSLLAELLDVFARWIHLIAGIMWIGNSLLFNWLDRRLESPSGTTRTPRPSGTIWLLHSGGFYYVEKTLLDGAPLPRTLHWFKWQAYTTWWSGVGLLILVYYWGGRALLTDAGKPPGAVALGAGGIVAGWLIYEAMQRLASRNPTLAAVGWITGLVLISAVWLESLSGRAAFLHLGAMLGTIMAGNVVFTIIPSQRLLVAAVAGGHGGDPRISERAKRVSIHNNYLTFPVLILMVSGHFSSLYSVPLKGLVLGVLIGGGAMARHLLNIRFRFSSWPIALAGNLAVTGLLLWVLTNLKGAPDLAGEAGTVHSSGPVAFAEVRHVIDRRCAPCHSARPTDLTFGPAPGGVRYDTPDQIKAYAARIRERAVVTRTMPPGNKTGITGTERELLGRWVAAGADTGQLPR